MTIKGKERQQENSKTHTENSKDTKEPTRKNVLANRKDPKLTTSHSEVQTQKLKKKKKNVISFFNQHP